MTQTARLLRELIAVPSVNPAFLPPGDAYTGELRVAEYLAAVAGQAGLTVELKTVLPRRPNLFVHLEPRGRIKHRVWLAPHLDTVGGRPLPGQLFRPRLKNGRLYGRGACDTKGSVAVMFSALCELARQPRQRPAHTEIIFVGLIDEEHGQAGSRALARSRPEADLVIVGEPTRCQVVTAHKGVLWLYLTTFGKAAHGARPELGHNAIYEMARVVQALATEYASELRQRRHDLLGTATVNVGSISGGRQPNIVPDECTISVDRRTLPGEKDARVLAELRGLMRRVGVRGRLHRFHRHACAAMATDPAHPWVQRLMQAARQTRPAGVEFFSDGGVLNAAGLPTVLFGPGDIAQAHKPGEWVELSQLERARQVLKRFLAGLP